MQNAIAQRGSQKTRKRMNPLLFIGLTLSACAVVHFSVAFLEPAKASMAKAVALSALVVVGSNVARWVGFSPGPILQWTVYIVVTACCVRLLYKLKSLNSVTVGACYVAGSYVLAQVAFL
jgi:hypothetical protein